MNTAEVIALFDRLEALPSLPLSPAEKAKEWDKLAAEFRKADYPAHANHCEAQARACRREA